jgi:hypothetical protein
VQLECVTLLPILHIVNVGDTFASKFDCVLVGKTDFELGEPWLDRLQTVIYQTKSTPVPLPIILPTPPTTPLPTFLCLLPLFHHHLS